MLYREIKTIPFPTSKAKRNISLYGVTNHSFLTLVLQDSRISWVLSNTHSHSILFVGWGGSLYQATQVLQWREKLTPVLELLEIFWMPNTIFFLHQLPTPTTLSLVLDMPRLMKASKSFPSRSPPHTAECSGPSPAAPAPAHTADLTWDENQ